MAPIPLEIKMEKEDADPDPSNESEGTFERTAQQASVGQSQLQVKLTRLPASVLQQYNKDATGNTCLDGDTDLRTVLGLHTELDIKFEPGEDLKEEPLDPMDHDGAVDNNGDLLPTSEHILVTNVKHINDHEDYSRPTKKQRKEKSKKTNTKNQNNLGLQSKKIYTTRARMKNEKENETKKIIDSKKGAPAKSDVSAKTANNADGKFDDCYKNDMKSTIHLSSVSDRNFSCKKCTFTTDIERVFKSHLNVHSAAKIYACGNCPYITTIETNLFYHIRKRHATPDYVCKICDKKYTTLSALNSHLITHSGEKSAKSRSTDSKNFIHVKKLSKLKNVNNNCANLSTLKCVDAIKKHSKRQDILSPEGKECLKLHHLRTHSNEKQYSCEICDEKFIQNNALSIHIKLKHSYENACKVTQDLKIHSALVTKFSCSKCKYTTKTANLLKSHLQAHLAERNYTCDTCSYITKDKFKLVRHLRHHTGEKPYACKICDKKYVRSDHLTKHIRLAHKCEYLHVCNICDRKFIERNKFIQHVRTHTGEKPYCCQICSKKFNRKDVLISHIRLTHKGEKLYSCKKCSKNYANRSYLKVHTRIHTGEKPFACKFCDKKFRGKSTLQTHLKLHTGEKPHACKLCGRKFITSTALTSHLKTHTGERPYDCKICGRKFARTITLKNHMVINTGGKPFACNICRKAYRRKTTLKAHISTHRKS